MELIISIKNRELEYRSGSIKGISLDDLICRLDKIDLDTVTITGESKSYTFLRQIALMLNLLVKIKKVHVNLKSSSFKESKGLLFPIYD